MAGQTEEEKDDIYKSMYANSDSEEKVESVRPDLEEKQPPKDEPDDSEPLTEKKEEAESSTEKDEPAEAEVKAEEEAEKKDRKKQGDIKSALREERKKRKELREAAEKEVREAREEAAYYKRLATDPQNENLTEEEKLTKQRLDAQEQELQELKRFKIEKEARDRRVEKMAAIKKADKELTDEGKPGFSLYYPIVTQRLMEMDKDDQESYDTPEGWKELWREEYPRAKKIFIDRDRQESFKQKDAAKENANFLGEKGGKTEGKEKKPYDPVNDYFKERGKKQIVS
jgi:hypothetical protein